MVKKSNKKNNNKKKAQGSLETLLLFGGAILLAAIVISIIVGMGSSSKKSAEENTNRAITMSDTVIPPILHSVSCADTTCDVFFQSFSNGTNELVIDKNVDGRTEITDNKTTIASALTIGKHSAYVLTTLNGGSAMSNTYNWDVTVGETPPATVATPTANPSSQGFETSVSVSLSCETAGANIYYTTNGSDPNNNSTAYSNQIVISQTTTLKAIAYVGATSSSIMSETYTKNSGSEIIDLSFEPPSGTPVTLGYKIDLKTEPDGAHIFYTLDGSNPNHESIPFDEFIPIENNFTLIKAIAYIDEVDSGVQSANYTVEGYVATPIAEPSQGVVSPHTQVTLSTTTPGAKIFYVLNEGDPKEGAQYTEPLIITENIKLIAVAELDGAYSDILVSEYKIGEEVAVPSANQGSGTYSESIFVKLKTDTAEATIFYTLDGSTPSSSSTRYETEIEITENTTLKAIAVLDETSSGVMTETYIFE